MSNKLVNLKDGNDILVPKVAYGIDVNNLLAELKVPDGTIQTQTYTATQDCIICLAASVLYLNDTYIDNVKLFPRDYAGDGVDGEIIYIPFKKGQTFSTTEYNGNDCKFKIYGLKY